MEAAEGLSRAAVHPGIVCLPQGSRRALRAKERGAHRDPAHQGSTSEAGFGVSVTLREVDFLLGFRYDSKSVQLNQQ